MRTATPAPRRALPPRPRWLDVVGALGVVALGFTVWLGLWITPPDRVVSMSGGRVTGEEKGGRRAALAAVPSAVTLPGEAHHVA